MVERVSVPNERLPVPPEDLRDDEISVLVPVVFKLERD